MIQMVCKENSDTISSLFPWFLLVSYVTIFSSFFFIFFMFINGSKRQHKYEFLFFSYSFKKWQNFKFHKALLILLLTHLSFGN